LSFGGILFNKVSPKFPEIPMKYTTCMLKRYGKVLLVYVAAAVGAAVVMGSSCSVLNKAPTVPVVSGPSAVPAEVR
jgi:hypothetical protein